MKTEKTKTKLRRGDTVRIIAGKDAGKDGRILQIDRTKNRVVVEGLNIMTKSQKPSRTNQTGGIIKIEAPVHLSNVMYVHNDVPTRLGYKVTVTETDGKRVVTKQRYAKCNGDLIDE